MDDSPLFGGPTYGSFMETRMDHNTMQDLPNEDGSKSPFISINIQMDDQYKATKRQVVTVSDAFSNTGGFMGIALVIF